jgi:hypothetical protein
MTDTNTSTGSSPKKSFSKVFWIIGIVLGIFGINHYTLKIGYGTGAEVTLTDSTIVVTPVVEPVVAPVADTTKADTTKK